MALLLEVAELDVEVLRAEAVTRGVLVVQFTEDTIDLIDSEVTDQLFADFAEGLLADAAATDELLDNSLNAHVSGSVKDSLHAFDDLFRIDVREFPYELLISDYAVIVAVKVSEKSLDFIFL